MHLYLHIPFCKSKCTYCDFVSGAYSAETQNKYIDALLFEMEQILFIEKSNSLANSYCSSKEYLQGTNLESDRGKNMDENSVIDHTAKRPSDEHDIKTIYIGGGTPSSLSISNMTRLLDALSKNISLELLEEFTIECNPESVTEELVQLLAKYHVNRISLGVQSANEDELRFLNRIHSFDQVKKSVALFRKYGITNYSLDLMFNLPNQTREMLEHTIREFIALEPTHISCYSLIIEDGTPMMRLLEDGKITEQSDDNYVEQYRMIISSLAEHGYHQYEIANFAKEGHEAIHNSAYWTGKEYFGLGVAAHSKLGNYRFANVREIKKYIQLFESLVLQPTPISLLVPASSELMSYLPFVEKDSIEKLSEIDQLNELFFLGLRKNVGITIDEIDQKISFCPVEEQEEIRKKVFSSIDKLIADELLQRIESMPNIKRNDHDKLTLSSNSMQMEKVCHQENSLGSPLSKACSDADDSLSHSPHIALTQKGREVSNSVFVELMI